MIKYILAGIVLLTLTGCPKTEPAWRMAPREYRCTTEEMVIVDRETKNCSDNTNYLGSFCYGMAMIRNCTKDETFYVENY